MNRLSALKSDSIFIIRAAFSRGKPLSMLWSVGEALGLKLLIEQRGFRGILLGIRRDEQAVRSKERLTTAASAARPAVSFWSRISTPSVAG